jgi:RNA recognition motif-containing protein
MASRIYVKNLPSDITEERLKEIFAQIGDVSSVRLKTDLITKRPKGCGFVEMSLDVDAYRAVHCFDGATMKDRKIELTESHPLLDRAKNLFAQGMSNVNLQALSVVLGKDKRNH